MLNYAKIDDKLYIPSHIISPEFFTALPPGLGFTLGSTQTYRGEMEKNP